MGIIILFLIIIFHFIDADHENAKSFEKERGIVEEPKQEKPVKKQQKSKSNKKKYGSK